MSSRRNEKWPLHDSHCCDCGIGCHTLGEYYMVRDELWDQAWTGKRKPHHRIPGQEILCIGCLENRIGRTLRASDFTDAPINSLDHDWNRKSERLLDRLTTNTCTIKGGLEGFLVWLIEGKIEKLPEHQREIARKAAYSSIFSDKASAGAEGDYHG
jgi:hypothetical protein